MPLLVCSDCTIFEAQLLVHDLGHSRAKIHVYAGDHAPPHFHVVGPDWSVSIAMSTYKQLGIRGNPPAVALAAAIAWAKANAIFLRGKWDENNERIH